MSQTFKSAVTRSVWHAPPNARFEPLRRLRLSPPTAEEVAAYRKAVEEETRDRANAYRTPVTEKTLYRIVR